MAVQEALSASLEDYLEAIFHIAQDKQVARAKDISKRLHVSSSSVTGALHALAERGLINYVPYDVITLTGAGDAVARSIVRRHEALRHFFIHILCVGEKEAEEAACKMEHSVPPSILDRFRQFVELVEACPRGGAQWVQELGNRCDHGHQQDDCENCIAERLESVRSRDENNSAGTSRPARRTERK